MHWKDNEAAYCDDVILKEDLHISFNDDDNTYDEIWRLRFYICMCVNV